MVTQRQDAVTREKGRLLRERGLNSWSEWHDAERPPQHALIHRSCGEWLQSRAARHGFEVIEEGLTTEDYRVHGPNSQLHAWHGTQEHPTLPRDCDLDYSTIDYRGELLVVDPVTFTFALQRGIGRGKSVRCGLLLINEVELQVADARAAAAPTQKSALVGHGSTCGGRGVRQFTPGRHGIGVVGVDGPGGTPVPPFGTTNGTPTVGAPGPIQSGIGGGTGGRVPGTVTSGHDAPGSIRSPCAGCTSPNARARRCVH